MNHMMPTTTDNSASHPAWCDRTRCTALGAQVGDLAAHVALETLTSPVLVDTGIVGRPEAYTVNVQTIQWTDEPTPIVLVEERYGDQVVSLLAFDTVAALDAYILARTAGSGQLMQHRELLAGLTA